MDQTLRIDKDEGGNGRKDHTEVPLGLSRLDPKKIQVVSGVVLRDGGKEEEGDGGSEEGQQHDYALDCEVVPYLRHPPKELNQRLVYVQGEGRQGCRQGKGEGELQVAPDKTQTRSSDGIDSH